MEWNINAVPDGARFVDLNPQNADPRTGRRAAGGVPAAVQGYQDIFIRGNFGTSNYNALQVQMNRRYIRGVQFGRVLHVGPRARHRRTTTRHAYRLRVRSSRGTAPDAAFNQNQSLVINYTWDIPGGSKVWSNALYARPARRLAGCRGVNAFVSRASGRA